MITEGVFTWILDLMGALIDALMFNVIPNPPDWILDAWVGLDTVLTWLYQLDHWIPVTLALTVGSAVLAAYFLGLIIGVIRVAISYMTFGGNT